MLEKIIDEFLEQGDKVAKYRQALQLLKEAGFIELLRKFGYPQIIDSGNNPTAMAVEAGISHGYQRAVSHLEFFYEMYALKKKVTEVRPSFGAEKILLKEKYLSEEDIRKIKGKL